MRLRNVILVLILTFIIGAIIFEVMSESVVKPVQKIQEEYNHKMDEILNSMAP